MKIDIKHIAKLASLKLREEDSAKFERQVNEIISYVGSLNKVSTKGIEITSQVTGLENVTRGNTPSPSLTQEEVLSGTKLKHNGFFKVDAILDNE